MKTIKNKIALCVLIFQVLMGCKGNDAKHQQNESPDLGSCTQGGKCTSESSVLVGTDSLINDSTCDDLDFGTISDLDMWLLVKPTDIKSKQIRRLIDAYNASVVQNSIMTDFDLQLRLGSEKDDVVNAIKTIEVSRVKDTEVQSKLQAYRKEMLYLLSVNLDEVDLKVHNPWKAKDDLYAYLSKKYSVQSFGQLDVDKYLEKFAPSNFVPEWERIYQSRGKTGMVEGLLKKYNAAKDFDARCIYAVELAHAYEADIETWEMDEPQNPAIPILESLMKEKKFSLYLRDLWETWRVLYQDSKGASKNSEIPNWLYNVYRNICCCTILSYIERNPQDINAINDFLVMARKENILREGICEYGNQYFVDMCSLFPEKYRNRKDEE